MYKDKDFEKITEKGVFPRFFRLKIFSGWLVYCYSEAEKGLTFVPDKNHKWKVK